MNDPDRTITMTPLGRSLLDLEIMIEDGPHSPFFRSRETIQAMHEEQKRLSKSMNIVYFVTGLMAFFILLGSPTHDAKISAFGLEAPLDLLPQQVLAVFMAGIFGFYVTQFASFVMLSLTIAKVLSMERRDSWQFLAAPYDATTLWATIIGPKTVGYVSPKRAHVLTALILLIAGGTVLSHAIIVLLAAVSAAWLAWFAGGWVSITLGTLALIIVGGSIVALAAATLWPMPYRWPQDEPLPSTPDDRSGAA